MDPVLPARQTVRVAVTCLADDVEHEHQEVGGRQDEQ